MNKPLTALSAAIVAAGLFTGSAHAQEVVIGVSQVISPHPTELMSCPIVLELSGVTRWCSEGYKGVLGDTESRGFLRFSDHACRSRRGRHFPSVTSSSECEGQDRRAPSKQRARLILKNP